MSSNVNSAAGKTSTENVFFDENLEAPAYHTIFFIDSTIRSQSVGNNSNIIDNDVSVSRDSPKALSQQQFSSSSPSPADTQPPSQPPPMYQSLVEMILSDPPPDYGKATGVIINVNEVLQEKTKTKSTGRNHSSDDLRTCPKMTKKQKYYILISLAFFIICIFGLVVCFGLL